MSANLGQPTAATGACLAGDNLQIVPGGGDLLSEARVPTLCGTLTGQHGIYSSTLDIQIFLAFLTNFLVL